MQHLILLRELLSVLSGVEGQYIRVKAPQGRDLTSAAQVSLQLRQLQLVIDKDAADRSTANQVSLLLPICQNVIHIREYLRSHFRYDYGYISHSTAAAIKAITREFDILIAQLENLYSLNKLSLQKLIFLLQPSKLLLCGIISPLIGKYWSHPIVLQSKYHREAHG